jgi:hypothetical protein
MNMADERKNADSRAFIAELYLHLLNRRPSEVELKGWTDAANRLPAAEVTRRFVSSDEYQNRNKVKPFFPLGHYHSPVVDPNTLREYVTARRKLHGTALNGINIDIAEMEAFWETTRTVISNAPFPEMKTDPFRFYFDGAPFPYGDALSLHAIMGHFRPKQIVEIGAGFSTACMLDSADLHGLGDIQITCVEPSPNRLRSLLKPDDRYRLNVIEKPVQEVPIQNFVKNLTKNDVLFIDSTHVLKTGSDVHYEIFDLMPAVQPGVVIHVHDCPYPFEYPQEWIEKNYSWNEVYAIRAFLMYNSNFKILFWGSFFHAKNPEKVGLEGGRFKMNPGTSLWLARVS